MLARNCRLLSAYTFSQRHLDEQRINLSALHLIQNNLMDLYALPLEASFADEADEAVEMTKPAFSFRYRIGQFIEANKSEKSDFSSFLFDNVRLLILILAGYLSVVAVTWIAPKLIRSNYSRTKSLKLTLFRFFFTDVQRLFSLSYKFTALVLSFQLFMFFNLNFLSGGIKTSKVVVNTDEIVDSISKLAHTQKTIGTIFDEKDLFVDQPDHSLLHLMSKKKMLFLDVNTDLETVVNNIRSYIFFSKEDALLFIFSRLIPLTQSKNLVTFSEPKSYHDSLGFFYMRRSLDQERKKFIHSR